MSNKNKRMLEHDGYYVIDNHDFNNYNPVGSSDFGTKIIVGIIIIIAFLMIIG